MESEQLSLRPPVATDGIRVNRLVAQCPPLDTNSVYCNLLQCSHFAQTSVAAEIDGDLVGFVSGYIEPDQADTLFIWQVAVSEKARGMGLATRMLQSILQRNACRKISYIDTTITEDNRASWALFERLAEKLDAELNHSVQFDHNQHFDGEHATEMLVRIGPFKQD